MLISRGNRYDAESVSGTYELNQSGCMAKRVGARGAALPVVVEKMLRWICYLALFSLFSLFGDVLSFVVHIQKFSVSLDPSSTQCSRLRVRLLWLSS